MSSFVGDLKGVVTGNADAMKRVAKTPSHLPMAVLIVALTSVAKFFQGWHMSKQAEELFGFALLDTTFLVKQAVVAFLTVFIMAFFIQFASTKWFKGAKVDLKGFMSLYGFMMLPMVLVAVPFSLAQLVALIWVLVLFFKMMKAIFGFGFGKALLAAIVGGFLGLIIVGIIGAVLGVNEGSFSFETSF